MGFIVVFYEKYYYIVYELSIDEEEEILKGYLLDSFEGEKVKYIWYWKEEIFDVFICLRKYVSDKKLILC